MAFDSKEEEMQRLFPGTAPLNGTPVLFRFNGCGVGIYGHRDDHAPTRSYVTTYCISFVFIPVIALCAYRVADGGGRSYYFLRKAPLSTLAKFWNILMVAAALTSFSIASWVGYTETPEYRASQKIKSADELSAAGKTLAAAGIYESVVMGGVSKRVEAEQAFQAMLDKSLAQATPEDAEKLLSIGFEIAENPPPIPESKSKILARNRTLVEQLRPQHPDAALRILDLLQEHDPASAAALASQREAILKDAVAQKPADPYLVSSLAEIYEKNGKLDESEKLLTPVAAKLGVFEGARILGQIYSRQNKMDEAFKLLEPYITSRLSRYGTAEASVNAEYKRASTLAMQNLRSLRDDDQFVREYKMSSENDQHAMVTKYVDAQVAKDLDFNRSLRALKKEAGVVPAAFDLALIRLRRAQSTTDEDARKTELLAAEKLFLAIRGAAGASEEFNLYFGQVCYWLGKHAEGQKEFDALLAKNNRSVESILAVANVLNLVGDDIQARKLSEEAYAKVTKVAEKQNIAKRRSVIGVDVDDRIKWLELCNTSEGSVQAELNSAMATKRAVSGDFQGAAEWYRKTGTFYESQPRNSVMTNNASVEYMSAFVVSGDRKDFDKSLVLMEESAAMAPDNAINILNLTIDYMDGAYLDVIGDKIDLVKIGRAPTLDTLRFLYSNQAERDSIVQKLVASPYYKKAVDGYDKLMILAPKKMDVYFEASELFIFVRDREHLKSIKNRLSKVTLDFSEQSKEVAKFRSGTEDAKQKAIALQRFAAAEKSLDAPGLSGINLSIVICRVVEAGLGATYYGADVDPDKLVALAERAIKASNNAQTSGLLSGTWCNRIVRTLSKTNADWAAYEKDTHRTLGSWQSIALATAFPGPLRDALLANEDYKRLADVTVKEEALYPDSVTVQSYPIIKLANPAVAAQFTERLKRLEPNRLHYEISAILNPEHFSSIVDQYFRELAKGDENAAKKTVTDAAERGLPIPAVLKQFYGLK